MKSKSIQLTKIQPNTGQIDGLPKNPRIIKDEKFKQLVKSIQEDPEMLDLRELIVYPLNGEYVVIAGNMRLNALKELGHTEAPCKVLDEKTTPEKLRAYTIKDNIGYGEHDWGALTSDWNQQELEDWGMDVGAKFDGEAQEDDYEIPDEIKTDIVIGDMFEIGQHRLLCGDSTQTDTFARLFKEEMADLVVTDPPYNVAYQGGTKDKLTIANDNMSNESFYQFLYDFYTALGSYTKAGGAWYVWQPDKQIHRFIQSFEDSGFKYSGLNVWVKNTLVMGRGDYHSKHETCIYGWKEGAAHGWYSDRKQTTVLEFDRPNRNAEHPTMKPIPLFSYLIGNSSKHGDIVADAFGGSGTTMVACHQMNRKAYLVEFDPNYCQVIIDRMIKLDPSILILRNGVKYEPINTDK